MPDNRRYVLDEYNVFEFESGWYPGVEIRSLNELSYSNKKIRKATTPAQVRERIRWTQWMKDNFWRISTKKREKTEKKAKIKKARQKSARVSAKIRRARAKTKKYKPWGKVAAKRKISRLADKLPSAKWRGQIAKKITYKIHKTPVGKNKLRSSFQSKGYRYNFKSGKRIRERYKPQTRSTYNYSARRYVAGENGLKLTSKAENQRWISRGGKNGGVLTAKQWMIQLGIAAHAIGTNIQNFKMIHAMRAQQVFAEAFVKQSFDNHKWQPLADSTIKKRSRNVPSRPWGATWPGKILADSGNLFNSIKIKNGPMGAVRVQASAPYAGIHNNPTDGMTYGKSKRRVVQRQFMGHSTAIEKFIALNIDKYMFDDVFVTANG